MRMDVNRRTIVFILAGGRGDRLDPLTRKRAKPAVPFGGVYRIIDFTLSNCFNSGLKPAYVLTQHKRESLHTYLHSHIGQRLACVPPSTGRSYSGTADAVYQNLSLLEQHRADNVLVLSADHIYKMDYSPLLHSHANMNADVTVAAVEYPRRMAKRFGIVSVDPVYRIERFDEKPADPPSIPGKPSACLASMGIYVFKASTLRDALETDSKRLDSAHDFGRDVLPRLIRSHRTFAFRFVEGPHGTAPYWRDVGTIDAYYKAHMELLLENSPFESYHDPRWPTCAFGPEAESGFPVAGQLAKSDAQDSFVCPDAAVEGRVLHSVISSAVTLEHSTEIRDSILFRGVHVGKGSRIRRAIVEEDAHIPEDLQIGYDSERDRHFFHVTEAGVVVVPAGARFPLSLRSERLLAPQTDSVGRMTTRQACLGSNLERRTTRW